MSGRLVTALLLIAAAFPAVEASSGIVINPKGEPLAGVRACYKAGNVEQLCAETDSKGQWSLPDSLIDVVRLSHRDYLPRVLDGGDRSEPVILHPAAVLIVKLRDAAGNPVTEGEVVVLLPSGTRLGPFPIRNAAGTKINSLEPGPVVILARSEGFAETRAKESDLSAGVETVATVRLERAAD